MIIDPGSYEPPTPVRRAAAPAKAPPAPRRRRSNALMIDAAHSADRAPADGRRPADRLLLSRASPTRSTCTPRPAVARRDLGAVPRLHADRTRPGLRDHAHFGERRHHRPVRETLCGGSDEKYLYKGKCRTMGHFNAGTLERRAGQLPDHGARPGRRVRDRQGQAGRDLVEALELRQGHARPALLPPPLERPGTSPSIFFEAAAKTPQTFNSFYIDNEHIADVHERPAADPAAQRRSRACRPTAPASTSGRASRPTAGTSPGRRPDATGRSSTGTTSRPRASAPRTTSSGGNGSVDAGRPARPQPAAPAEAATASGTLAGGDRGDERRARPRTCGRSTPCRCCESCSQGSTAPAAQAAQMLSLLVAWRERRRQPARPGSRRRDRRPRRGDHGHGLAEDRRRVHEAGARRRSSTSSTRSSRASISRRAASTAAGTSTSIATSATCSGAGREAVREHLLRRRQSGATAARRSGTRSRRPASRADRRARDRRSGRLARRRDRGADPLRPGVLPTTMRYTNRPSGIQQVISFRGHR